MSSVIELKTDLPSGKIIRFNVQDFKLQKDNEIKEIVDSLTIQEKFGSGKIFKRKDNGDLWFVENDTSIARLITQELLELGRKWEIQELLPDRRQFDVLKQIGGLPSPDDSFDPRNVEFPAKVILNCGEEVDFCIVCFSKLPPFFYLSVKRVILFEDIKEIRPSEFALSYDLRIASTKTKEIMMSFYPFMVKTNAGEFITYNGETQFASNGPIKGRDIISQVDFSHKLHLGVQKEVDNITYIFIKWDSEIEKLYNPNNKQSVGITGQKKNSIKQIKEWWQRLMDFFRSLDFSE